MKKAFISIFTDGTNEDVDYSKVLGALGLLVFLGISFYSYGIRDAAFAPVEWAAGFTTILAGAAGVSKLKDKTVPPPEAAEK